MGEPTIQETVSASLSRLVGEWSGEGVGEYPTIDPFSYVEESSVVAAPEYPMLRWEQRAWLEPDRKASHWEVGFWRVREDGVVELSTAQDSGRVEVLRGRLEEVGGAGLRLHMASAELANDPRLVATERTFELEGDTLRTTQHMSTTTTEEPQRLPHLRATLTRRS